MKGSVKWIFTTRIRLTKEVLELVCKTLVCRKKNKHKADFIPTLKISLYLSAHVFKNNSSIFWEMNDAISTSSRERAKQHVI